MRFIVKRLLTTILSAGIFVLVAASASSQPTVPPPAPSRSQATTFAEQRGPVEGSSGGGIDWAHRALCLVAR